VHNVAERNLNLRLESARREKWLVFGRSCSHFRTLGFLTGPCSLFSLSRGANGERQALRPPSPVRKRERESESERKPPQLCTAARARDRLCCMSFLWSGWQASSAARDTDVCARSWLVLSGSIVQAKHLLLKAESLLLIP
jgi:hypothetical protein